MALTHTDTISRFRLIATQLDFLSIVSYMTMSSISIIEISNFNGGSDGTSIAVSPVSQSGLRKDMVHFPHALALV